MFCLELGLENNLKGMPSSALLLHDCSDFSVNNGLEQHGVDMKSTKPTTNMFHHRIHPVDSLMKMVGLRIHSFHEIHSLLT